MLTKVISWMKSLIVNPTPRGVPVSLVQPWSWSLYYIRFRYPNKFIEPHLDARWDVSLRIPYPLPTVLLHLYHICGSVVCHHSLVSLIAFMYNYWHACNKIVEHRQLNPITYLCYWLIVSKVCLPVRRLYLKLESKDWFLNKYFYWKTGRDKLGT